MEKCPDRFRPGKLVRSPRENFLPARAERLRRLFTIQAIFLSLDARRCCFLLTLRLLVEEQRGRRGGNVCGCLCMGVAQRVLVSVVLHISAVAESAREREQENA